MKTLLTAITLFDALSSSALAEESTRITSENQYRSQVVGKTSRTLDGNVQVMTKPDGTIAGDAEGTPIVGTWRWSDGLLCTTVVVGSNTRPEAFKLIALAGTRLLVRGDGKDVFYELN